MRIGYGKKKAPSPPKHKKVEKRRKASTTKSKPSHNKAPGKPVKKLLRDANGRFKARYKPLRQANGRFARKRTVLEERARKTPKRTQRLREVKHLFDIPSSTRKGFTYAEFVPLVGDLLDMWLEGDYESVLSEVRISAVEQAEAKGHTDFRILSVRLVIDGRNQKVALKKFDVLANYLEVTEGAEWQQYVDGFSVRISVRGDKPKPKRKSRR